MDTLSTKRETQIVKSSVGDIPRAKSFQQTLIVALLRFDKHLKKPFQLCKSWQHYILLLFVHILPCHYHQIIVGQL